MMLRTVQRDSKQSVIYVFDRDHQSRHRQGDERRGMTVLPDGVVEHG